jgi:hypothetical protein
MKAIQAFTLFGKNILIIALGTFFVTLFVKAVSLAILTRDVMNLMSIKMLMQLFSLQMLPNLIAFGFLIAAVYYLYQKTRKNMLHIHENEIELEREQVVLTMLQRITGLMAEYISAYNGEITQWIENRKKNGSQPPERIVTANRNISIALETLTKVSFVMPYMKGEKNSLDSYTDYLEEKLIELKRSRQPLLA